jgi:hypothetical protein
LHPAYAGEGTGAQWWCDKHKCYHEDYAFVEAIIIVMLLVLALLFDAAHRSLEHIADRSYWYGKLQSAMPNGVCESSTPAGRSVKRRQPLLKHWLNRLSEEFMVLGFLAFVVFVFREAGFFDWLVQAFPPDKHMTHLPQTGEDWLHMVENVHMKLFLGMIVYFMLILKVVNGCSKHVAVWEEMRILRRSGKSEESEELSQRPTTGTVLGHTRLRTYVRWRLYFIRSVMSWRDTRPQLYEETLRRLSIWSGDTPSQSQFERTLDQVFPFSAYLAYSVRACCKDMVEIHHTTWAAVIVLFSALALIHRYVKLILLHFMPAFIVVAFVLLFCVGCIVHRIQAHVETAGSRAVHTACAEESMQSKRKSLHSANPSENDDRFDCADLESAKSFHESPSFLDRFSLFACREGFHERYPTELWVFRTLQIVLFVMSYSCARTVGDTNDWRNRPYEVLAVSSGFVILFLLLGSLLPKYVPNFAALMAMPPYCDQKNVDTFFEVLNEYNKQHGIVDIPTMTITGSRRPVTKHPSNCSHASPRTPRNETSEVKALSGRFEAVIEMLMQQQHRLAHQVQCMHSSMIKSEGLIEPDPMQLLDLPQLTRHSFKSSPASRNGRGNSRELHCFPDPFCGQTRQTTANSEQSVSEGVVN